MNSTTTHKTPTIKLAPALALLGLVAAACGDDAASSEATAPLSETTAEADNTAMGEVDDTAMGNSDTAVAGALAVTAVDHLIVNTPDRSAHADLFSELLGWNPIAEGDSNTLGTTAGIGINLVDGDDVAGNVDGGRTVGAVGFRTGHFVAARDALSAASVDFEEFEFPLPDGQTNQVLAFQDPSGTTINVVQPVDEEIDTAGTGSLVITALDHVIMNVSDRIGQGEQFAELLGWNPIAEGESNTLGTTAGIGINLVDADLDDATDGTPAIGDGPGVTTIGLRTADISGARAALRDVGITTTDFEFPLPDGTVNDVVAFEDLGGTMINIVQPK